MAGLVSFCYGAVSYALFLVTFTYAVGLVGNLPLPKTVGGKNHDAVGLAIIIDLLLIAVFAVQHSVMARPGFRPWR